MTWLPFALVLTAVINLAPTPLMPRGAVPIVAHEDGSLTYLVHVEQTSVDRRFGFYLELDDATDGGLLIVPPDSFVVPELAEGFADFEVTERNYDVSASLPTEVDDIEAVGLVETDEGDLTYSIVSGAGDVWWLAHREGGVVVVSESVVPVPETTP